MFMAVGIIFSTSTDQNIDAGAAMSMNEQLTYSL
jgi:hypothetical protein